MTKKRSIGCISLALIGFFVILIFIEEPIASVVVPPLSRLKHKYQDNLGGGTVVNNTSVPLKVTDWRKVHELPVGKSSKEMNLPDIDGVILTKPSVIGNHFLLKGSVIKLCDTAELVVSEQGDRFIVREAGGAWFCKLIDDYGFYSSLDEAFPLNGDEES